jgi:hypothetical protein
VASEFLIGLSAICRDILKTLYRPANVFGLSKRAKKLLFTNRFGPFGAL